MCERDDSLSTKSLSTITLIDPGKKINENLSFFLLFFEVGVCVWILNVLF